MPVGYTYITRSATGWVYGGKRESATFDHNYYGSGRVVRQHIAKYGHSELLTCEPVEFYETYEELYEGERQLIAELRAVYGSSCVNILDGGDGWRREDLKKMWQDEFYRKIFTENKIGEKNPFYGKKHTKEALEKISFSSKGERHPNFGKKLPEEIRKKISQSLKGKAFNTGKTLSAEYRKKISESKKGEKRSLEAREKVRAARLGKKLSQESIAKREATKKRNRMLAASSKSNLNLEFNF